MSADNYFITDQNAIYFLAILKMIGKEPALWSMYKLAGCWFVPKFQDAPQ